MLIKQDGNLQKRHYIYIHIYIYALYIVHICTFTIMYMSKRGVLGSADDDIACFLHILSILVVIYFLADHEHVFLANICIFYIFIIRYCICLHILTLFYYVLLFMERFVCNLHAYSAYLQYHIHGRHGTVEKCIKHFGFLGVSGLNK